MTEERFYCERPKCSVHNKKTKALANSLKFFKNAEFGFGEDFTPEMFFDRLKEGVARLNNKYKGREIEVTMMRFGGTISYDFKDNPNSDACLGGLTLMPIVTTLYLSKLRYDRLLFFLYSTRSLRCPDRQNQRQGHMGEQPLGFRLRF